MRIENGHLTRNLSHESKRGMPVNDRTIQIPATPYITEWDDDGYPRAPSENEHGRLLGLDAARTGAL